MMRWILFSWLLIAGCSQLLRLQTDLRLAAGQSVCKTIDCQYETLRPDRSLECRYLCAVIEIEKFLKGTGSDTLSLDDFKAIHNQAPGFRKMAEQWAALSGLK
jgi:hypothetical protein